VHAAGSIERPQVRLGDGSRGHSSILVATDRFLPSQEVEVIARYEDFDWCTVGLAGATC